MSEETRPDRYTLRPEPDDRARRFLIDYKEELNPSQYEAAVTHRGPLLVLAGAGSGKTRTLVFRVARMVEEGVDPASILLLTFTRRASEEMLQRVEALLGSRCDRVTGGTFHSFANTILRRYAQLLGFANAFTILDRSDSEDVINLIRSRMGLDKKERRFPRKQTILEILSLAANKTCGVAAVLDEQFPHLFDELDELGQIADYYRDYKRERSLLDYDDLLSYLRELLRGHPELAERLSLTFRYIMVDEYQDTNRLQADIVRLLAHSHDNVMAVGDDAQSIYSFRGATVRNIFEFPDLFPGTKVIKLEENYRSTQPILDLSNEIILQAKESYTKNLFTRREAGIRPVLVEADSERYQSRFVGQKILELHESGVPLPEIAVLFRSSFHSFDLEIELGRRNLQFVKRGGFKFIETTHIKDVLAHLRIIANPQDAVSWYRVLLLLDGVGAKSSEKILAQVLDAPDPFQGLAGYRGRGAVNTALKRLAEALQQARDEGLKPAEQLEVIVRYYGPILKHRHHDDYPKRQKDLEHFTIITERYHSLDRMLSDMALEPPTSSVDNVLATDGEDEGLLTLSTIHSAKGLEWHSVFIIWAVEGRFPSLYNKDDDELEEERRLMYVAATRAKENLFITYPINVFDRATGMLLNRPSRFLDGIPRRILTPVMLMEDE
ncbi:MAG: UvrD-helicase domain-containing protein [Desulfurellaceae bacterium]|nr:UvrD-helicase domain-containing protein [Desulfurellaceae bacterium]